MMTDPRAGQISEIRTADELRQWLSANRVHGLSAGHCDKRSIEATSLIDGSATSLDVPTDLHPPRPAQPARRGRRTESLSSKG